MTPTTTDAPPAPSAATLAYATAPGRDERPYGRADRAVFVFCAALAGANLSLGAVAFVVRDDPIYDALVAAGWAFFAYVALFAIGQYVFWRRRPRGDLPPISAFALACVAALSLATFLGTFAASSTR